MFGFKKRKPDQTNDQKDSTASEETRNESPAAEENASSEVTESSTEQAEEKTPSPAAEQPSKKPGLFARLTKGLKRTRSGFTEGVATLVLGKKAIDDEVLEDIEALLLGSDVGIEATEAIIDDLTARLKRNQLNDTEALFQALTEDMLNILEPVSQPLQIPASDKPFVILMVGINGAGKTTTIGKLAKRFQQEGRSVMLAAGDTFRAAAVEQLQEWGKRNDIPVIAQQTGADSASVIYDAVQAAHARKVNVLIADTAGRLHTQANLMEELKKVRRVMTKLDPDAPHEVMIVLDASIGQNAVLQAKQFQEAVGVSGVALTKLDGTAKGGVIFAIARQLNIPIRYIGIGEGIDDLRDFNAQDFVNALLQHDTPTSSDSGGS